MRMFRLLAGGFLALALLSGAAPGSAAGTATRVAADDAPVAVPALVSRVTDTTGTFSAAQKSALEQTLAEFERRKGSQIAVLVVASTKPEAIEQYAIRVAEQWKLGRKGIDDGLLLLIAKNDQRIRIEVGRGLEGPIPDVIAKRIIREIIAPHFVAGDFYAGIDDGVHRIIAIIDGEPLPPPPQRNAARNGGHGGGASEWNSMLTIGFVLIVVAGGILTRIMGKVAGSGTVAAIAAAVAWVLLGGLIAAVVVGIISFIFALIMGSGGGGMGRGGGWGMGGGGFSGGGGFGGGGGFSGGGGDFGGGGASGSWGN